MTAARQRRMRRRAGGARRRELLALALLVPAASCVPETAQLQSAGSLAVVSVPLPPEIRGSEAAPLAIPSAAPAVSPFLFRAGSSLDRMRALDCLAEAVYYEARSESEGGQRAVAQVVLNRVRHPGYPSSVCGVVFQGPMRPGGGCQFTFTCDGSLARRPIEPHWSRARRIAAEALSGEVFAPVGAATHYHRLDVAPAWAPALVRAAFIGAHIFYRLPGSAGAPAALTAAYSGREPSTVALARFTAPAAAEPVPMPAQLATASPDPLPAVELAADRLPESRIRPEWAHSGRWKTP